jgi:hypothetical protein
MASTTPSIALRLAMTYGDVTRGVDLRRHYA